MVLPVITGESGESGELQYHCAGACSTCVLGMNPAHTMLQINLQDQRTMLSSGRTGVVRRQLVFINDNGDSQCTPLTRNEDQQSARDYSADSADSFSELPPLIRNS